MALSFCGTALISLEEREGFRVDPRAFVILLAALSTSFYLVFQKPYLENYGALALTAYAIGTGTVLTFVLSARPRLPRFRWLPYERWSR